MNENNQQYAPAPQQHGQGYIQHYPQTHYPPYNYDSGGGGSGGGYQENWNQVAPQSKGAPPQQPYYGYQGYPQYGYQGYGSPQYEQTRAPQQHAVPLKQEPVHQIESSHNVNDGMRSQHSIRDNLSKQGNNSANIAKTPKKDLRRPPKQELKNNNPSSEYTKKKKPEPSIASNSRSNLEKQDPVNNYVQHPGNYPEGEIAVKEYMNFIKQQQQQLANAVTDFESFYQNFISQLTESKNIKYMSRIPEGFRQTYSPLDPNRPSTPEYYIANYSEEDKYKVDIDKEITGSRRRPFNIQRFDSESSEEDIKLKIVEAKPEDILRKPSVLLEEEIDPQEFIAKEFNSKIWTSPHIILGREELKESSTVNAKFDFNALECFKEVEINQKSDKSSVYSELSSQLLSPELPSPPPSIPAPLANSLPLSHPHSPYPDPHALSLPAPMPGGYIPEHLARGGGGLLGYPSSHNSPPYGMYGPPPYLPPGYPAGVYVPPGYLQPAYGAPIPGMYGSYAPYPYYAQQPYYGYQNADYYDMQEMATDSYDQDDKRREEEKKRLMMDDSRDSKERKEEMRRKRKRIAKKKAVEKRNKDGEGDLNMIDNISDFSFEAVSQLQQNSEIVRLGSRKSSDISLQKSVPERILSQIDEINNAEDPRGKSLIGSQSSRNLNINNDSKKGSNLQSPLQKQAPIQLEDNQQKKPMELIDEIFNDEMPIIEQCTHKSLTGKLQRCIRDSNNEDKLRIFKMIKGDFLKICCDPYGKYVANLFVTFSKSMSNK